MFLTSGVDSFLTRVDLVGAIVCRQKKSNFLCGKPVVQPGGSPLHHLDTEARAVPFTISKCFPYKYLRVTFAVYTIQYLFTILLLSVPKPESLPLSAYNFLFKQQLSFVSAF